jgi:hypothetical protein
MTRNDRVSDVAASRHISRNRKQDLLKAKLTLCGYKWDEIASIDLREVNSQRLRRIASKELARCLLAMHFGLGDK